MVRRPSERPSDEADARCDGVLDASEARWMQGARKRARRRTYGASPKRATKRRSRRSLQRRRAHGGAGGNTWAVRGMRCGVPGRKARCAGEIEPSVTTSWSAQAERDRGARGTPSPRPAGAGFVRHTARFDRATRDGCRGAQATRRTLAARGRHCTTSSDDVVATAPTRIHRGDREGNLQGRRGGAGEATHVERRVRRVRPSGSTGRLIDSMTFARTSGKRVQDGL